MIDVDALLKEKLSHIIKSKPKISKYFLLPFLKFVLAERKLKVVKKLPLVDYVGKDFVKATLKELKFRIKSNDEELKNIPSYGRVVIIANHPIGSLDGFALLTKILEVRSDVKIVANDWLESVKQIKNLILPVNNIEGRTEKKKIANIYKYLNNEGAVIIFPAGEVSRYRFFRGFRDGVWRKGFYNFAQGTSSPILPIFLAGKNSRFFYFLSYFNKNLSSLWLVRELFKQKGKTLNFIVGEIISFENYNNYSSNRSIYTQLFKQHLYCLAKQKKKLIFKTEKKIISQSDKLIIEEELTRRGVLLMQKNNYLIYNFTSESLSSPVIQELGRLREISFRAIGGGTGKSLDVDDFDRLYNHLIVWDQTNHMIVGAYRVADVKNILEKHDISFLYSNSIYSFSDHMIKKYLSNAVELGRSFIYPEYWRKGGLRYLFQAIDSYAYNIGVRYLFGMVSISNQYSPYAKDLIVFFCKKYYYSPEYSREVSGKNLVYSILQKNLECCQEIFTGSYKEDLEVLKKELTVLNLTLPTLLRYYIELVQLEGLRFYDFTIDVDFNYTLDAFIVVDTYYFSDFAKPYFSNFYNHSIN